MRGKESYGRAKILGALKKTAYDNTAIVKDAYLFSLFLTDFMCSTFPFVESLGRENRPGDFFVPMFRAMFSPLFYALFHPLFYAVLFLWFYLMFHPLFYAVLCPLQQYGIISPYASQSAQISSYPSFLPQILNSKYCIELDKKRRSNVQDTVDFAPQSPLFSLPQSVQTKKCTSSHIQIPNVGPKEQSQSRYQVRRIIILNIMIPSLVVIVPLIDHIPPPGLPIVYS